MKKPLKIAIIVLAVVLVVIAAVSLFVKSYLTEERMRALVSEIANKSLNRKTVIGAIDVSLFRGIVVKDFEIREKNAESVFIKTKEFVLTYQFLPLLTKKLVIDKLSIVDAEIYLKTNPDGTYNFSDMAKPDKTQDEKDDREKVAGLPVTLNVKDITIKNAKLGYTDAMGKLQKADVIMNAELKINGLSPNALSSSGSFDITIAEALLKNGNKSFKDIKTAVRYKIDADTAAKQVTIHSIDLDVMKIPVNMTGTVNYSSGTAYSLVMKVPDFNLSQIRQELAAAFLPKGMALGGNVSMLFNIDKIPDEGSPLRFDGRVKMTRASCAYKGTNLVLDGSLKLTPEMITLEDLKLIAGPNKADMSGSVKNYKDYPDLNVKIKSKFIAIDDLFAAAPASAKSQETAGGDTDKKGQTADKGGDVRKEPEPMNLKFKANVSLDIDKTRYKGISITNFMSRYELKDNIFNISFVKGNTLSGAFALKGAVNLASKGTRYNMNADLNGVRIEEIINAFAPKARGKLFGALSGRAAITGSGTLPVNVKRNLKGNGKFTINNGVLKNSELVAGLLTILGLRDLKEIPIEKANSQFTISDGTVNLTTLIGSRDMMINETGTVGMDEKLDLGILVKVSDRLAPKVVSQSSIAKFLSGEKGWTSVPLRVKGTISKPSYGIDTQAVGRKVGEGLQKKAEEELRKILLKEQKKSSGTQQNKSSSPRDLIRDIFGK
ncbi:MAG: AsmA family protein [Smithellaceae bacterium]